MLEIRVFSILFSLALVFGIVGYKMNSDELNRPKPFDPLSSRMHDPLKKLEKELDAPYVQTTQMVLNKVMEVAKFKKTDVVYDLGCGNGLLIVEAAKRFGVSGIGVDLDPNRVSEAREKVKSEGVGKQVVIHQEDVFKLDLTSADVILIYMYPEVLKRLIPQFLKMRPGSRIISEDFTIEGFVADETYPLQWSDEREKRQLLLLHDHLEEAIQSSDPEHIKKFDREFGIRKYYDLREKFRPHAVHVYHLPLRPK